MAAAEARACGANARNVEATDNLAWECNKQGRYVEALQLYRQNLQQQIGQYGQVHSEVAKVYGNIGCVYESMGDHVKALECHKRDLQIKLQLPDIGPDHQCVAATKNKCASSSWFD